MFSSFGKAKAGGERKGSRVETWKRDRDRGEKGGETWRRGKIREELRWRDTLRRDAKERPTEER